MSKITKIRWVIAHEPVRLFYRSAKDFETALNQALIDNKVDEKIEVEVMTPDEYSMKYNDGITVTKHDLLDLMDQGRIEMSQMYSTWMAEKYAPDLLAFEMPFIFRDHDHATQVLEGTVGEKLLSKIQESSKGKVRGLSYTYSGGFRCAIVNEKISTLGELVGKSVRSNRNPVAQAIWNSVGAEPYVCEIEDVVEKFEQDAIDAADTVYSRVYPLGQDKYTQTVFDSKHTLFLTTMLVSEHFWNSISDEVKAVIKQAAIEAGRSERRETIEDGEQARQQLINDGATIVDLSDEDAALFRQKTQAVYEQFADFFEPGLIDSIRNLR
jgi:TRAP-type C4-dicarboxylate transport system substrate-binding protein